MKHILVTGGAGFIGSNLIASLLKNKDLKISCLDIMDDHNYSSKQKYHNISKFYSNPNFVFYKGDICRMEDLNKIESIDIIIHLAAKAGVRNSIKNPLQYQTVNVLGTQNLLEFSRARNISRFLFASSSSVYGINKNAPWNETEALYPISPYAATKISGEMLGHVYSYLYGITFISLRFFTVYGPGQRPDLAIHKFFKAILDNRCISIYGRENTSRDYTYIDDLVCGIIAATEYNESKFEIINIGNQNEIGLSNLLEEIQCICKTNAIVHHIPCQKGDVPRTLADITKASKLLSYHPKKSLRSGLNSFFNWLNTDCLR